MASSQVTACICAMIFVTVFVQSVSAVGHVPGMMLTSMRQECYGEGEKCIGAPGYPWVPYKPCCSGSCSGDAADWGKICTSSSSQGQCYKNGEKCQGAPGFPYVPYLGCCDGECTGAASDWGKVCVPKSTSGGSGVSNGGSTGADKACYSSGERCEGAPGKPAVPYLGCCAGYECTGTHHEWGKVCVKKGCHRRRRRLL